MNSRCGKSRSTKCDSAYDSFTYGIVCVSTKSSRNFRADTYRSDTGVDSASIQDRVHVLTGLDNQGTAGPQRQVFPRPRVTKLAL